MCDSPRTEFDAYEVYSSPRSSSEFTRLTELRVTSVRVNDSLLQFKRSEIFIKSERVKVLLCMPSFSSEGDVSGYDRRYEYSLEE